MFTPLFALAVAPTAIAAPAFQGSVTDQVSALSAAVVAHAGDNELRDRLCDIGEVWFDAGDFLVGSFDAGTLSALRLRGVDVTELSALGAHDEIFVVDMTRADVRADVDSAASVLYQCGKQAVVAVPHSLSAYPESLQPGRICHSGHTAVARRAMRRAPPVAPRNSAAPGSPGGQGGMPGPQSLLIVDPRIQNLVTAVSKTNIESWVVSYSAPTNRDSQNLANFNASKATLIAQLQSYGYSPTSEAWNAAHGTNVYVDIPGVKFPNRYVVFGAHFDTRNYSSGTAAVAHGADDNTSGTAAVLEIARLLSTAGAFENSVRLVWFSGEEYGLLGSNANAQGMLSAGKQVVAMLNMDMISYRNGADVRDCDFATNNTSASLTTYCMQTAPLYVPAWAATSGVLTAGSSDHASYNSAGFPAAFFFEDLTQYFTQIHTPADIYPTSTTDFDLAQMICRGVLACGASLAEPADLAITHTELPDTIDASGPYVVSANIVSLYGSTVSAATLHYSSNGGQSWQTSAMSSNGTTWSGSIAAQGSPLTIAYYIDALDDQGAVEFAPEGVDAGGAAYDFFVGTKIVVFSTGFEEATDNGWTHGMTAGQDDWQRGTPAAKAGDPGAAYAGTKCWGNDLGPTGWNGSYANNVNNWLRSPVINCSALASVKVEFRRWLGVETSTYDQARIKVNGTTVWTNPTSGDLVENAWSLQSIDISAQAAHNASVQIEFSLQSDGGLAYGGWNIDDFQLVELGPGVITCPPASSYCTAKLNSVGCTPAMSTAGTASATSLSAFTLDAAQVINQQNGLLFYGFAASATPLNGGIKCVANPVNRLPMMFSSGNVGPTDCSGVFSYDFNARIRSGADAALVAGEDVFAQYWYRDPASSGGGIGMTDAVQFRICP